MLTELEIETVQEVARAGAQAAVDNAVMKIAELRGIKSRNRTTDPDYDGPEFDQYGDWTLEFGSHGDGHDSQEADYIAKNAIVELFGAVKA